MCGERGLLRMQWKFGNSSTLKCKSKQSHQTNNIGRFITLLLNGIYILKI